MAFLGSIPNWIAPPPNYSRNTKISRNQEWVLPGLDDPKVFVRERVKEIARRQKAIELEQQTKIRPKLDLTNINFQGALEPDRLLATSYDKCVELFLTRHEPFPFGTSTRLAPERFKALCAIWAWGIKIDELVDGFNGGLSTHETLDLMEERMVEASQGRAYDIYDIAFADTLARYPLDIQIFRDEIDGTRVDLANKGFRNFDELYIYKYFVHAEPYLSVFQVLGKAPESTVSLERIYDGLVSLAFGLSCIDALADIVDDAQVGRIYFSKEELQLAGVSEDDLLKGRVTDNGRNFIREQVKRARMFYNEGTWAINELNRDYRWELWTGVLMYKQILDNIEANNYDCFSKSSKAGKARMISLAAQAYAKSLGF